MFEKRFTKKAENVLKLSEKLARDLSQSFIGTEHILFGLIREKESISSKILSENSVNEKKFMEKLEDLYGKTTKVNMGKVSFTPRTKQLIEMSFNQANAMGQNYIGTEHLLLALLMQEDSVALRILKSINADREKIKNDIYDMVDEGMLPPKIGENRKSSNIKFKNNSSTPFLNGFSSDLTKKAYDGLLDPVIGRDNEIDRIIQILCRRTKNNPCLIGEPGVGKTAIIEALAEKIVTGDIPAMLKNKRIVTFDISAVIAGTKYRGEFEERIKKAIEEVKKCDDVILFIDEIHNIVGAGAAEGAIDAANILKPALSRGEIQIIGATTIAEYRKYIERDSALERRFQSVTINEPSTDDTIKIIEGLKDKYESHHSVKITDEAIRASVELSQRYLHDRFLPDKAIDLIDEACSAMKLKMHTEPENLKKCESEIEGILREKAEAITGQDYNLAAKIKLEEESLREEYNRQKQDWQNEKICYDGIVDEENIKEVISKWTDIPIGKMKTEEQLRYIHLEDELKKSIKGQDRAISSIAKAVRIGKAGLNDPKRPIGTFLFLGPTGVGKTQLSKKLAETLFGSEDSLIKLDMSEYMEKHSVSKLIGSPPGYVGYDDDVNRLTELVRRKPYSVILFDEIEKAHSEVYNLLLQLLDEGVLTDSKGKKVNFKNTIIIMTSNLGSKFIVNEKNHLGFEQDSKNNSYEEISEQVKKEAKNHFNPEFLNRIDEIIVFNKLSTDDIKKIVEQNLDDISLRLKSKNVNISFDLSVIDKIVSDSKNSQYGARPIKRNIEQLINSKIAFGILENKYNDGRKRTVYFDDNILKIEDLDSAYSV